MAQQIYQWLAQDGGVWSLAANWSNITSTPTPATTPPGAQDEAMITGATGSALTVITGGGTAALAEFTGNCDLTGSYQFGSLSLGTDGNGGLLGIASSASLTCANATIASGSLLATASTITVSSTLTLGTGQFGIGSANAILNASHGATITLGQLVLNATAAAIAIDSDSSVEIGTLKDGTAGALTIDTGHSLSGEGDAQAYGQIVNNGTITAQNGSLMVGTLTGAGLLDIAASATLILNGRTGAGQSIGFTGANASLAISAEIDGPQGTLTGFGVGDTIDELYSPITGASYTPGSANSGTLTLSYGGQTAQKLILAGNYSGYVFLTASDGAGGTIITTAQAGTGGGTTSPGTPTQNTYLWSAAGSGAWNNAANWTDQTTSATPAAIAPGHLDLVTITGATQGSFTVITGPAAAAALTITGGVATTGTITAAALALGTSLGGLDQGIAGTLDILGGSIFTTANATITDGAITVTGNGAKFTDSSTLTMGGGNLGVGLPVTALSAGNGAVITLGGLTMGGGSSDFLTTDPVSSIEIGNLGNAALGAIIIDAGSTLGGNGAINPFGKIIDNGTISAQGGDLALGYVTGTGSLLISANATLELHAATAMAISFSGTATTLKLDSELYAPTGTLSGFVPGDVIDFAQDPISAVTFATNSQGGILTLSYDGQIITKLTLAGIFTNERFYLVPDATSGTAIDLASSSGTTGTVTQGSTDLLAWTNPVTGAWAHAGNWSDLTTGENATAAPGTRSSVQIAGPEGNAIATIAGPGGAANLSLTGNLALNGNFTTTNLSIGTTTAAAEITLAPNSTLATVTGTLTNGVVEIGTTTALSASASFTLGTGAIGVGFSTATLSAINHGFIQLAALSLGGGANCLLETDGTGTLEIGSLGGAAGGAITIDLGIAVAGNGEINPYGLTIDNGTLSAAGGTLTLGTVTGTGLLTIGALATFQLQSSNTCAIDFTGNGGALILSSATTLPAAPITGFAAGDMIISTVSPISAVSYSASGGNNGVLSLYYANSLEGTLALTGNYAGDVFTVQQNDGTAAILVAPAGGGGASAGTPTPDSYQWIGNNGVDWNDPNNWIDSSASQTPSLLAPGLNDLVTIAGPASGGFATVTGPGNCAQLNLSGQITLGGTITAGTLTQNAGGYLAVSDQTSIIANNAMIDGTLADQAASIGIGGLLALGSGPSNGIILANGGAQITATALTVQTAQSAILVDATSSFEVGNSDAPVIGALSIDAGATLSGQGAINTTGSIVDDGLIAATGGTLVLGNLSGGGLLTIDTGADLVLADTCSANPSIDFLGTGTLVITATLPAASISGFGENDVIEIAPANGNASEISATTYIATSSASGELLLQSATGATLGSLTLTGADPASSFSVTTNGLGEAAITVQPPQNGGGYTMTGSLTLTSGITPSGSFLTALEAGIATLPAIADTYLQDIITAQGLPFSENIYLWQTENATGLGDPQSEYGNIAVVSPLQQDAGSGIAAPAGYLALIATGETSVNLFDRDNNPNNLVEPANWINEIIIGNQATDSIVGSNAGDVLIGTSQVSTEFWDQQECTIVGSANDSIITGYGDANITTSDYRSLIFAGPASNTINSNGTDTIIGAATGVSTDTVNAYASDLVFGPGSGEMLFNAVGGPDSLVGSQGQISINGSAQDGSVIWGGTGDIFFQGGAGNAAIVQESGEMQILGGSGATTFWGGTGASEITGTAGNSEFVVGEGSSTISAAAGNIVFLIGDAACSIAGTGNGVQINAASSTANNIFQAGAGDETILGGQGNDLFAAGSGNSSLIGGTSADTISLTDGTAGGNITAYEFNASNVTIDLHDYGISAQTFLDSATVSGGSMAFNLPDGSQLNLIGITSLSANQIVST